MTFSTRHSRQARPLGIVSALALSVLLTACVSAAPPKETPKPSATVAAPAPAPTEKETPKGEATDMEAAYEERDAFFEEQGFNDGGPLKARTDAQKALVQAQREWTEKQGGTWTDQNEMIILALASDTCESGILNGHRIDDYLLKSMVASSPLTQQLIPADAAPEQKKLYERNIASMSVFGASYLCPADKDAWQTAFKTAYPE